jgi:ribokinase
VAAGANAELRPDAVKPLEDIVSAGDVLLLQLEIPVETVGAAARVALKHGARIVLDPAPARRLPDALFESVSVLTPNELEAKGLTGVHPVDDNGLARAADVLHERGTHDVLITLGARGTFVSSAGISEHVPAFRVDAIDTTAAGDVFNGALAVAFVEQRSLRDAVVFASAAAALSVTRMGAQASAPRRDEIEAFLAAR